MSIIINKSMFTEIECDNWVFLTTVLLTYFNDTSDNKPNLVDFVFSNISGLYRMADTHTTLNYDNLLNTLYRQLGDIINNYLPIGNIKPMKFKVINRNTLLIHT